MIKNIKIQSIFDIIEISKSMEPRPVVVAIGLFFWVWGRKSKLEDHITYRRRGGGGLWRSSGGAFDGGTISTHS